MVLMVEAVVVEEEVGTVPEPSLIGEMSANKLLAMVAVNVL